MYVYVCVHVCIYVYKYIDTYIYIYIHIYIYHLRGLVVGVAARAPVAEGGGHVRNACGLRTRGGTDYNRFVHSHRWTAGGDTGAQRGSGALRGPAATK